MGATYTRQSSYTDGDVITAAHTNDEFNQLLAAFQASSGHTHDGTANEGGPITKLLGNTLTFGAGTAGTDITITFDGETSDGVLKWMEDEDYFEFSDDILIASTEKLQFRDTAIYINSSTDGQLDIVADTEVQIAATTIDMNGNADVSGTLTYGSLSDGVITITGFVDEDNMASNSATLVPTQQSVKAYVDTQLTAEDLDFQADSGGALSIDLDSETLTFTGGTGIDTSGSGNAVTFAIDSTVATLAGSQALTNKTIDVDNNTVSNIEVDNFKASVIVLESEGIASNDNDTTIPTSAAVKDFVDTQITAEDLDFQADTGGALSIDLNSETLTFTGGTGIDTSGSGNAVTFAIDSTVTTLTGSQTLTNKTLTTPIANAGIQLKNGATSAGFLEFFEDSDNGTNKVTLIGPASTADVTLTLPSATDTLVGKATTDTLTNKSIDSDNNTITNIVNADIKSSAAIADSKLDTISTANKVALTALDIDGATDIGEAVADADLLIIDNGAGGTNRKVAASAIKTYVGTELANDSSPQLGGDLDVNGNDIVSTSNADIDIVPNGTGNVTLQTDTVQLGSSNEDVTVTTNGTGDLTLNTNSGTNSGSIVIADGANQNVTITPNGSGKVVLDGISYPTADGSDGQVLVTDGGGNLSFSSVTGTTINNNADNRVITGSSSANTLEAEANLTFDGTNLTIPSGNSLHFGSANAKIQGTESDFIRFSTSAGGYRFAMEENGRLGIGFNLAPSAKLHVSGSNNNVDSQIYLTSEGQQTFKLGANGASQFFTSDHSAPTFKFSRAGTGTAVSGTDMFFIDNNNIQIRTDNQGTTLNGTRGISKCWHTGNSNTQIDAHNVSGYTDHGTGQQTVVISHNYANANYCISFGSKFSGTFAWLTLQNNPSAGSYRFTMGDRNGGVQEGSRMMSMTMGQSG